MKRISTIFLQIVVILIGISAAAFLLLEPHLEGRNVHATLLKIYFNDPFLVYAYTASIAFFIALFQVFKLLGFVERNEVFSQPSVKALQTIKYCAMTFLAFVMGAEAYLGIMRPGDDIAGGIFVGLLLIVVSGVTVSVADMFEKILQNVVDIKFKNSSVLE